LKNQVVETKYKFVVFRSKENRRSKYTFVCRSKDFFPSKDNLLIGVDVPYWQTEACCFSVWVWK